MAISRDELITIVGRIASADGSEEELDELLDLLDRSVGHPAVSDLIFYSDPPLSPAEVVDQALAYRPVPAGPSRK